VSKFLAPFYWLKEYITDALIISSHKAFLQERYFYFRVFKKNYVRYKYWIEPKRAASSLAIDIFIPVIEKDLNVLPHVIQGIKTHLKHPLKNIYIVAPNVDAIKNSAIQADCIFVDETTVCTITKKEINFLVNGYDRSGWIYQQLLKFNFDKIGSCEHYLVVDADTVFIRDICFEGGGKLYFDFSDEYHQPYFSAFEMLTGLKHSVPVSYIAHYMLFKKSLLRELKDEIEKRSGKSTERTIIGLRDKIKEYSYFSEYETYANYCTQKYPKMFRLRYWFNKSFKLEMLADFYKLKDEEQAEQKSLSFHSYNIIGNQTC
jgi:hypothetical protein